MEVFHCDGKEARDMKGKNRCRRSRERSGPELRNRTNGMSSGPGLWNGLARFVTAMMPATLNGM